MILPFNQQMHFEDLRYASLLPSTGDPATSKVKPVPSGHSTKEEKVTRLTFCCGTCRGLASSDGSAVSVSHTADGP